MFEVRRTRKIKCPEENVGSANVKPTLAEVSEIREAVGAADVVGESGTYPKETMGSLFADTPDL